MAIQFLNVTDFNQNNLTNVVIEVSTSAPVATPGAIYFDSSAGDKRLTYYAESGWIKLDQYSINAAQDGDNVDLNLASVTGYTDSVVQFTAGTGITLTRNSGTEMTIAAAGSGTMSQWYVRDDDNDDAQIDSGEFLKVTMADGAAGTNLSGTGTTGDPYVLALTSPGDTTYSKATDSALGLVKLEDAAVQSVAANAITTTASRTYGVQFNASDQLVVNVPWTDTGGDAFTTIDVPIGGNPVAVGADTLVLQSTANSSVTNTSSVVMSGNTGTDTIDLITRKFESFIVTCTDEKRVMTTGDKFRFRVPNDFTIENYGAEGAACNLAVKCHVNTPPSSGEGVVFQVDIQKNTNTTSAPSWSSILSTKLTIDAGEYTSTTATTPAVVSGTSLNCDDELLFKVDVCTGAETGLKVIIVGFQTTCQG